MNTVISAITLRDYMDQAGKHLYGDAWDEPGWRNTQYSERDSVYDRLRCLGLPLSRVQKDVRVDRTEDSIVFDIPRSDFRTTPHLVFGIPDYLLRGLECQNKSILLRNLHVALDEMTRNAIEHGNEEIVVNGVYRDGIVELSVEDQGDGFDPNSVPDPSIDPWIVITERDDSGKRPGGYGLLSIVALMDSVEHNESGNKITVRKMLGR